MFFLIMNECFMMGVFDGLKQKLPPFQEYSTYIHEKKATALVAANNTKTIQFSDLRKAVFFLIDRDADKETFETIKKLGCIAAKVILY